MNRSTRRSIVVRLLAAPGAITALLLAAAVAVLAALSPYFLDPRYLLDRSSLYVETGLMALTMTLVIIGGEIDLSCASVLALVPCLAAALSDRAHVPFGVLVLLAPVIGALLGSVNAWLVAVRRLPSLAVTLGTMALYRGLAQVLAGDHSLPLPAWFTGIDRLHVAGSPIAAPLVILVAAAVVASLVLGRSVFGRWVFSIGQNREAARFSGVPVAGVTAALFIASGAIAAIAGMLMASRLGVARFDQGRGLELNVVTAVVLGGTSIFGGRGTIFGSVMALCLIAAIETGMGVLNVKAENQTAALGTLLVVAVLALNLVDRWRS